MAGNTGTLCSAGTNGDFNKGQFYPLYVSKSLKQYISEELHIYSIQTNSHFDKLRLALPFTESVLQVIM